MNVATRRAVYELLKTFTQKSLKNYDVAALKRAYPFHRLFFDEVGLLAFKQERSIVTKMGQQLYPALALLVARSRYQDARLEYVLMGEIKKSTADTIAKIVRELRVGQRRPDRQAEFWELADAEKRQGEPLVEARVIADLYIGDYETDPLFAEIKTPVPNLDICAETQQKILTFMALTRDEGGRGYMAFPYNPFITRAEYRHSFTERIMDLDREVLIADEFWDALGGDGTFQQLLDIIETVGDELRPGPHAPGT